MTPFSCQECRAQLAALTNDANLSARPKTAASTPMDLDEMSPETAAHLQSCDKCQIEYSMLRGIVAELRALPAFAAPPDLRARISHQIALETASETATKIAASTARQTAPRATPQHALPRHALPRRSLFPKLFMPRWATYSLSGALATAFLLFVARDINSDFAPNQGSQDTSSSVQQAAPSQLPPATKRVAPAPKGKTPSATNNRAKSTSNDAFLKGSSSQKVAPVPSGSASGAPSSTRSAPTLPSDNAPAATEGAVNTLSNKTPATQARAAQAFKRAAPNQTKSGTNNSSFADGSAPRVAAPQIVAPEEHSAPLLLPSSPDNATEIARRNKLGTASNAGAPTAPDGSASARMKTAETSSASAKPFARLELLPSAAPSPLQKVRPTRSDSSSMRRQDSLRNTPSMSKSTAKSAGAFDANGSNTNASSANVSGAGTMRPSSGSASNGNSSVSGALSSAQSSTRSAAMNAARNGQNANQSADAALPSQHDESVYRSRVAGQEARAGRAATPQSSASTGEASSTMQNGTARAARGALAPSASSAAATAPVSGARAGAQSDISDRDSKAEKTSNTASQQSFATTDAAATDVTATPLRKPLSPVLQRKSRTRNSGASAWSANGLNQEKFTGTTRQDARLIVMPRQNASRARVVVVWTSGLARAKKTSLVVWQGTARRGQEIVISLVTPRGNKNRRAQVSLQSANVRGGWQTLDTTVLSATSTAR